MIFRSFLGQAEWTGSFFLSQTLTEERRLANTTATGLPLRSSLVSSTPSPCAIATATATRCAPTPPALMQPQVRHATTCVSLPIPVVAFERPRRRKLFPSWSKIKKQIFEPGSAESGSLDTPDGGTSDSSTRAGVKVSPSQMDRRVEDVDLNGHRAKPEAVDMIVVENNDAPEIWKRTAGDFKDGGGSLTEGLKESGSPSDRSSLYEGRSAPAGHAATFGRFMLDRVFPVLRCA